jgi:hypothetical protein
MWAAGTYAPASAADRRHDLGGSPDLEARQSKRRLSLYREIPGLGSGGRTVTDAGQIAYWPLGLDVDLGPLGALPEGWAQKQSESAHLDSGRGPAAR